MTIIISFVYVHRFCSYVYVYIRIFIQLRIEQEIKMKRIEYSDLLNWRFLIFIIHKVLQIEKHSNSAIGKNVW